MNNSTRLKKPRNDWWIAWTGGAFAQILYNAFSMQLYHYYIYFYIVGLILLTDSLIGWGKLNVDGIKIRIGLGFKSILYFKWRDISEVQIVNIKKTSNITSGGLSKIPFTSVYYDRALVLTFNNAVNRELKTKLEAIKKRSIFKEKVALDDQKNKLMVFEKPEEGFRKIVSAIKSLEKIDIKIGVEKDKEDSLTLLTINRNFRFLIDLFVIVFAVGTIFYYL
jgi:hypothetical protein